MIRVPEGWVATLIFTYLHTTSYFQKCFTLIEDNGSHGVSAVLEIELTELQSLLYYFNSKGLSFALLNLQNNQTTQLL